MSGNVSGPPVITIDENGISAPVFADWLAYAQGAIRSIYRADIYLGNDNPDAQLLAIFSAALNDATSAIIGAYNCFSPATAQGIGLSSVVKINGIQRAIPSNSKADLVITGQAGTIINFGIVADDNQQQWFMPDVVTIPLSGQITVTATSEAAGAVSAEPGSISDIRNPTRGWQSASNPAAATPGMPVETDAALRQRQSVSTMLPSLTVLDGMIGAVASVTNVGRYAAYENDTNETDINGIPPHTLAFVVEGGDAQAIATAISTKKSPGAGTFGTTSETVTDDYGIVRTINFSRPTVVTVSVAITIKALSGYNDAIGVAIVSAVASYITNLAIGADVLLHRLYGPALLGAPDGLTYDLVSISISRSGPPAGSNIVMAFGEVAFCDPAANVVLTVT